MKATNQINDASSRVKVRLAMWAICIASTAKTAYEFDVFPQLATNMMCPHAAKVLRHNKAYEFISPAVDALQKN